MEKFKATLLLTRKRFLRGLALWGIVIAIIATFFTVAATIFFGIPWLFFHHLYWCIAFCVVAIMYLIYLSGIEDR